MSAQENRLDMWMTSGRGSNVLAALSFAALLFLVSAMSDIFIPGASRYLEAWIAISLIVFSVTAQYALSKRVLRIWIITLCMLGLGTLTLLAIWGSRSGRFLITFLWGTLGFCTPLACRTIIGIIRRTVLVDEFVTFIDLRNMLAAYIYWLISSACLLSVFQLIKPANFSILHPSGLFLDMLYFCTVTFTTVGYGDVTPITWQAKTLVIIFNLISFVLAGLGIGCIVKGVKSGIKPSAPNPGAQADSRAAA